MTRANRNLKMTLSLADDSQRQAGITNSQLGVVQRQLDEMQAEQRPWINIESVTPTEYKSGCLIRDQCFFTPNGNEDEMLKCLRPNPGGSSPFHSVFCLAEPKKFRRIGRNLIIVSQQRGSRVTSR